MSAADERKYGLSMSPVFAALPEETLHRLSKAAKDKVVPAGTIIFRQGDPGDSFCVISSGRVRVFRRTKEHLEIELNQLGTGAFFGEMALITGRPRSAYAQAMEKTRLVVIRKDQFDEILESYPSVSMSLVKEMSIWLLQDDLKLERETARRFWVPCLSWFDLLVIVGLSLLFGVVFNLSNPNGINLLPKSSTTEAISAMSLAGAMAKHAKGEALFLDARPSGFFEQQRIAGAVNLPPALFDIIYMMELSQVDRDRELILYGRTISRHYDAQVAGKLILRGHKNTRLLDGGLTEWKRSGYPVEP